jgi:hypothetical protein
MPNRRRFECCENCFFWKKHEGQTERPFWGLCIATQSPNVLVRYIKPVPEKLETVGPFRCAAFQPSSAAIKERANLSRIQEEESKKK